MTYLSKPSTPGHLVDQSHLPSDKNVQMHSLPDHNTSLVTMSVISGPHQGQRFEFNRHDTFVAGRSGKAHLSLPNDPRFSRYHFRLEIRPPECYLVDLDSRNGTLVNGTRVSECLLNHGDVIRVGRTELRVDIDEVEADSNQLAPQTIEFESDAADPKAETHLASTRPNDSEEISDPNEQWQPVPGYRITEQLGQGAMGAVYRALQKSTSRSFAIKLIVPHRIGNERDTQLFLREVSVLSRLDHPRIVKFFELGVASGQFYFVMEDVNTVDFQAIMGAQSPDSRLRISCGIVCQVLEALEYAHAASIVHRDIKPANILLTKSQRKLNCKLADFGLAKNYANAGFSEFTKDGEARGTVAFMPPEQLIDFRYSKPAVDIYSVGATLYYYLAGTFPYEFSDDRNAFAQILQDEFTPLDQHCPEIPSELVAIVHRALARDPSERFASAQEMHDSILPFSKR